MSSQPKNQLYHDVLPYVRRKPQYIRPRMKMTAPESNISSSATVTSSARSIDGIVTQTSRVTAAPHDVSRVRPSLHTSQREIDQKHFDIVDRSKQQGSQQEITRQPREAFIDQADNILGQQPVNASRKSLWRLVPVGVAVLVMIGGFGIFAMTLRTNQQVVAQVSAQENDNEESAPAEEEVSEQDIRNYSVSPDMPRLLTIDSISVKSRITRLGMLRSGALAAPSNVFDSGWYEGSSKPGYGGAVLLVGHVHGPSKPGVFAKLHKLQEGETITVTRGDGTDFSYKVVKKQQVAADAVNMADALVPVTPGKAGLNIITCAGELIPGTSKYADRIIVYAEAL